MTMRSLSVLTLVPTLALAAALSGCAGLNTVTADVSSYGEWPSGKAGGSYAFDRLPSQQAHAPQAQALEAAAQSALTKAGFKPVAQGQQPDVLVQVGSRSSRERWTPWADPLWLRGGFGYWRPTVWSGHWYGPYGVAGLHARSDLIRYENEVALLIRDRASGKPLFEARAAHEGPTRSDAATISAMFDAALVDFPKLGSNPRRVTVPVASAN